MSEVSTENIIELLSSSRRVKDLMKMQVMLMSDNDEFKKLCYYVFSSSNDVDYFTVDSLEDQYDLLDNMDIIVFNQEDMEIKEKIIARIKEKKLSLKLFVISNQKHIRQIDKLKEHVNGVHKLFKKDFLIEDFIMSVETFLENNFYSKRLVKIYNDNEVLTLDKKKFQKKVNTLIQKKVFFSLVSYEYESNNEITSYNLQKIVREYDNIFINEKTKKIKFLMLNVSPEFAKATVHERIKNFSISLIPDEATSAFNLVYE
jgi:hypothetical protein